MGDQEQDIIGMSDEDFLNLPTPELANEEETEEQPIVDTDFDPVVSDVETVVPETADETSTINANTDEIDNEDEPDKETVVDSTDNEKVSEESTTDTNEDTDEVIDYKAAYKKIMAPFKANGVKITPKSLDDVRQYQEMGANYHKNMAALKPQKKVLKLLEKNGLMDQEQLNYLIDLNNKNPDAITKLLKDSGMDPLDIVDDVKKESNYSPTQHEVSDKEIALEEVLEDIRATPTYERTLNIITKDWDDTSCDALAASPNIIKTINGHVESGVFDKVTEAVTYERSLGRLSGVTDFEAYKRMGDVLFPAGTKPKPTRQIAEVAAVEKTDAPTKAELDRKARKKGAAPVKAVKAPASKQVDPLLMSDEAFAKLDNKLFRS